MGHFTLLLPIALLSMPLLIPTATSEDSPLLNKLCGNTSNTYAPGDGYAKNIKNLLDLFYNSTSKNNGFMKESSSKEDPQKPVYGLALCRPDISTDDCEDCIYDARCKITRRCHSPDAIVWYDNCLVRYSDEDFFGKVDTKDYFVMINVDNMNTSNPATFNKTAIDLLTKLSAEATYNNKTMFSGGEKLFDHKNNVTVYGMAFCTRDLSAADCRTCLNWAVKELPIYKGDEYRKGARVVTASCTVRYEIYTFVKEKASA